MENNFNIDFADAISKAFELLGFDAVDEKDIKEYGQKCKEKICKCKDELGKMVEEKKEDIKSTFKPLVNLSNTEMREHLDNGDYSLQIVATGYDETMVKVNVNPNDGMLTITSNVDMDCVWFMPNINMTINLPKGIRYDSLKKTVKNGMIMITGKVENVDETEMFTL